MSDRIFLDTDVILDTLTDRKPFSEYSARVLGLAEQKYVVGFTSSLVIANTYFYIKKISSRNNALELLKKLRLIVKILAVDDSIIEKSLESNTSDFEDAIQANVAHSNGLEILVTRNKKDFKKSKLRVFTPQEYLNILEIKR